MKGSVYSFKNPKRIENSSSTTTEEISEYTRRKYKIVNYIKSSFDNAKKITLPNPT